MDHTSNDKEILKRHTEPKNGPLNDPTDDKSNG